MFQGVFCGRVYAGSVVEDIFLSERDSGGRSRGNGRAACIKRSEREMAHKKT